MFPDFGRQPIGTSTQSQLTAILPNLSLLVDKKIPLILDCDLDEY